LISVENIGGKFNRRAAGAQNILQESGAQDPVPECIAHKTGVSLPNLVRVRCGAIVSMNNLSMKMNYPIAAGRAKFNRDSEEITKPSKTKEIRI
jgi:hypothetical protein